MIFSDDIFSDDLLWWSTLIIFSDDGFYKISQIAEGVSEWQSCLNARDATASKNHPNQLNLFFYDVFNDDYNDVFNDDLLL